jgi:hypothetical protein
MPKYATSASFWNKKLSGQHLFLPFKIVNDIAQFANNSPNQLQTKVNTRKQGHMERYNHVKSYA